MHMNYDITHISRDSRAESPEAEPQWPAWITDSSTRLFASLESILENVCAMSDETNVTDRDRSLDNMSLFPMHQVSTRRYTIEGVRKRWYFGFDLSFLRYSTYESSMIIDLISWRSCPKIFSCCVTISFFCTEGPSPPLSRFPGNFLDKKQKYTYNCTTCLGVQESGTDIGWWWVGLSQVTSDGDGVQTVGVVLFSCCVTISFFVPRDHPHPCRDFREIS